MGTIRIGTAGWSIPAKHARRAPPGGSHLLRYASALRCVEINSSFYRPHRAETYKRWADTVPADFSFSVKLPKRISHELRLASFEEPLEHFLAATAGLGEKLGVILVQTPPSLAFDGVAATRFLAALRGSTPAALAFEPRHPSWFGEEAAELFDSLRIARVAADPPTKPGGTIPCGWGGLAYFRFHGSPRVYWSDYPPEVLAAIGIRLREFANAAEVWCIFDNTAAGHAFGNALSLAGLVEGTGDGRRRSRADG